MRRAGSVAGSLTSSSLTCLPRGFDQSTGTSSAPHSIPEGTPSPVHARHSTGTGPWTPLAGAAAAWAGPSPMSPTRPDSVAIATPAARTAHSPNMS